MSDMAKNNNTDQSNLIKYLKNASDLGFCEYSVKNSMKNGAKIRAEKQKKVVLQFTLNGEFIQEYNCAKDAGDKLGCNYKNINCAARGALNQYFGYKWKYKEGETNGKR